ncbi:MAG TPA: MotA/TolQ/ExbB proton channel family protein [Acidiphilium sp.]|jgi:biopolymer transport protein ExbB|uniref:MotA/TolQ/ExbB proton channel family protein n=1 Tax=unclassified Acidiphilium TaxID=2617493 RepID=UPI000BC8E0AA|nr:MULTISPECIES: MotA/TolQ/ExbB proton channel family protein [unclassified Acidiphilium]OYV56685.1 MAG: flagellar motor protein MotA [Acidiphilium sp. 20-67-58]HQT60873.1 MotA/TolQ/ExbB proton channel family protein [Acidiphilium sp.]HQU10107.1 MotA/TolQ/ExbB proton channel family protein [Acidiphilium sp.]
MTLDYIIHLANYSDGVLYVLAGLFVIAVAVIIDRMWYLRRAILRGSSIVRRMAAMGRVNEDDLTTLRDYAGRMPEALLLDTALNHMHDTNHASMNSRMDEAIMLVAPRLDRRMWVLDTIVTLAPLLGLFGTIIGMFHAFSVLATPGHAPAEVTGGVADALVATACGIFIAMIGLATFNMLQNQVRLIIHQLETIRTMVLNRTDGAPVVPHAGSRPAIRTAVAA